MIEDSTRLYETRCVMFVYIIGLMCERARPMDPCVDLEFFFFQAEDGIRGAQESRGLGRRRRIAGRAGVSPATGLARGELLAAGMRNAAHADRTHWCSFTKTGMKHPLQDSSPQSSD